jgi:ADP-ribosyl-[dinitrogen reductase] hydrolase
MAGLIVGALQGASKAELLGDSFAPPGTTWENEALHEHIERISAGSFKRKEPPAIRGTGFVVDSLEAALWAFHKTKNFREGALLSVNLGDDADTTGAVYGQIAGAYYGFSGIPEEWSEKIALRETVQGYTQKLCELSLGQNG